MLSLPSDACHALNALSPPHDPPGPPSTIFDGAASLAYMNDELKNDKAFMMEVVKRDVFALEWASDELKADRYVTCGFCSAVMFVRRDWGACSHM